MEKMYRKMHIRIFCRFDLIFLMLDPQNEAYDRKLARHLVSLYYKASTEEETEHLVIILFEFRTSSFD